MREFDFCVGDILDAIPSILRCGGNIRINNTMLKLGYLIYRFTPKSESWHTYSYYIFKKEETGKYRFIGSEPFLERCKHAIWSDIEKVFAFKFPSL